MAWDYLIEQRVSLREYHGEDYLDQKAGVWEMSFSPRETGYPKLRLNVDAHSGKVMAMDNFERKKKHLREVVRCN